ncbi:MAG: LysM peptidoglycan-binding domain-containing protein [Acidobacteria bacterium]|nr:MAG: LysM peptidoglycan-binding domain-containing protein [Acidobacteriota bacterium]
MLRPRFKWLLWPCTSLLLVAAGADAQVGPENAGHAEAEDLRDEEGWHVVRPGETMRSLARRYLGDEERWTEIMSLNPSIDDPSLIFPGQRLRVPLPESHLPESTALVVATAGRVENQLRPLPWEEARRRNVLFLQDAIRTYESASSELLFSDATRLVLSERSLIFLRDAGTGQAPVDRELIEIEVGQADLEYSGPAAGAPDVEIILGESTARPRPDDGGKLQTRARLKESKRAELMVYDGASELAAAGASVTVEEGMGATVEAGAAPSPPEPLLAAPELLDPPPGSSWPINRPLFRWQPVAGAASYTLEVCGDARCGELVSRATGLEATSWRPAGLPVASLYWRVNAVSPSGLDGYLSTAVPFDVLAEGSDENPPWAQVRFNGPQVSVFDRLIVGVGATVEIEVGDEETGVADWTPIFDGAEVDPEVLRGPWEPGDHTVAAVVTDRAGNRFELEPVTFAYDPNPPEVEWGFQDEPAAGFAYGIEDHQLPAGVRRLNKPLRPIVWSHNGTFWRPLQGRQDGVRSTEPLLMLKAEKKPVPFADGSLRLDKERHLWIRATDAICRGVNLSVQVVNRPQGPTLVVRSVDLLANKTELAWPLMTRPPKR